MENGKCWKQPERPVHDAILAIGHYHSPDTECLSISLEGLFTGAFIRLVEHLLWDLANSLPYISVALLC